MSSTASSLPAAIPMRGERLNLLYSSISHALMHLMTAFYAVIVLTLWRWFLYSRRDRMQGVPYLIAALLVTGLVLFQGWYGGEMVYSQGAGVATAAKGTEPAADGKQRLDKVTKSGD